VSLALFALVAAIWGVLLIPLARGAGPAPGPRRDTPGRLSRGARPWTTGDLPAEDPDPEAAAALALRARRRAARRRTAVRRRRVLLVLAVATAAGMRAWAAAGGRWWVAPVAAGGLLAAYLATLVGTAWRRTRRAPRAEREAASRLAEREAGPRPAPALDILAPQDPRRGRAGWGGPVAPTTE
jgi:hypothetical protein